MKPLTKTTIPYTEVVAMAAIWLLSDVCTQLLDCIERFQTEVR